METDKVLFNDYRDSHSDEAFAQIAERHGAMVLRTCLRILGNRDDAEDASQATFIELFQIPTVTKDDLAGWLHKGFLLIALLLTVSSANAFAEDSAEDGKIVYRLILPAGDEAAGRLAHSTLNEYLGRFYNLKVLAATDSNDVGRYIVVGTPANNPVLAKLVEDGVKLTSQDIGNEGFQLLGHDAGKVRYVIIYGKTPRALKHGCQELVFYHMPATAEKVGLEWPLDVVRKPEIAYRGIYTLPCWAPFDSLESWQRVLQFNSELTLNRVWFWLDGFPVAGHGGEFTGTPLANDEGVQHLIDFVNAEDMKFYIAGGWLNWHQEKVIGKDTKKAREWYLAYLKTFKNVQGLYFEPTGEGYETDAWRAEADELHDLMRDVLAQRPDFELAAAIGIFNNPTYLKLMAQFDPKRVYWWWCWGDPLTDRQASVYPSLLSWHCIVQQSYYEGTRRPPAPVDRKLSGVVTSYDPAMGFGNSWNGWGRFDLKRPRNFDPYTMPYFGHEYYYRERCWNLNLTEAEFLARLQRRLFDDDAPPDAASHYWRLSSEALMSSISQVPEESELAPVRAFLDSLKGQKTTPKMGDTLARMREALTALEKIRERQDK